MQIWSQIIQKIVWLPVIIGLFALGCSAAPEGAPPEGASPEAPVAKTFEGNWESLVQHEVPEWLADAKFGIYAHWGVYSVPAYGNEWYAKEMYDNRNKRNIYQHHMETYSGPAKFGYKEFVPQFKAKKYDPEEWADLIVKSGAKYAGIAVVHHDGFLLWDSDINRWNAGNMGPKRDLYGELVKSLRARDMKTIATFHHFRTFNWYVSMTPEEKARGIKEGWDLFDPEYADLYWNEETGKLEDFAKEWQNKVKEVIDKYQPDLLWFDGGQFRSLGLEDYVTSTLAYYLNKEKEWNTEVEILNKLPSSMTWNFPEDFGVLTFEEGRDRPPFVERPWIDDQKIGEGSWGYIEGLPSKKVNTVLDGFIDRVARNGGLLLSLSPKADGSLPQNQKDVLLGMGDWLRVNGEAIYGTRPWSIPSEGNTDKLWDRSQTHAKWVFEDNCTAEDIRFTRKGNTLYAIALDWPANGKVVVKSLAKGGALEDGAIESVALLGAGDVQWSQDANGLTIQMPQEKPCDHAFAFRINVKGDLTE